MISRLEKHSFLLSRLAADGDWTTKASPGNLRQKLGVVGVRLVMLKLHHCMGLAGIDHINRHAQAAQLTRQPGRHGSRLQNNPLRAKGVLLQRME